MLTLYPVKEEKISSKKLLQSDILKDKNIEKVTFIPPIVGRTGFGFFTVRYKSPVLRRAKK